MIRDLRVMLDLFERRERWQLAVLFFVTLLMAFVQVLGVVSVMPFMALLASPGLATEHEWLRWAYEFGGFESTRTFTFAVGAVVLVVFTVSNGLAAFTTWLTFRFTEFAQHNISRRLLARYLSEPYVFFLDRHTSTLNYRIQTEVPWAVNGYVLQVIQMMTRGSVAVALLVLLLFVNAVLSLIVAVVLGGSYLLIYWLVRDRQQRTGAERAKALSKKYKIATESLAGIKEARVLGREPEFLSRFTEASWIVARNSARGETIAQMPRYAVETLGIGGVVLIALYLLGAGQDIAGILPILSLYALAGYRILPALQLIYSGAASVRFSLSPLYALHKDLIGDRNSIRNQEGSDAAQDQADTPLPFRESIRLSSVWYRYPGSTDRVINDASMSITRNTSIAFVGPTGSGKTTIVDILLGLLPPDKGAIYVDDHRLTDRDLRRWRRLVGYVPQDVFLADDTISRNIAFGLSDDAIDMDAVRQAAAAAHADEFIGSLPEGYDTLIGERGIRLSGGQRQRIGIARALYHQPEVLIMDEATSALDGSTEQQVMDAVRGLGRRKTIILIAHRLTTVEHCDVIYVLDRGFIVDSGTYQELMQRSNKFRLMARARASE